MSNILNFISEHIYIEYCLRLLLSLLFGSLLGFERKLRKQIVGMRTLVMISVSSALMAILSVEMSHDAIHAGDPTRVAAGVITGIGFVGGGAIMKQGLNIKGLTTAAIIFATAGIGLACGAGLYLPALITFTILITSLFTMEKFEHKVFRVEKIKILTAHFKGSSVDSDKITQILTNYGFYIEDLNIEYNVQNDEITLVYMVRIPHNSNSIKLADEFSKFENLINFRLNVQ